MNKFICKHTQPDNGFTLVELLVVAAIIGILLALAIPNLLKARISANEANARKMMQTLRDAEGLYYHQDLDSVGGRDYTSAIGDLDTGGTLRCPLMDEACNESDAFIDSTFEDAFTGITSGTGDSNCSGPKAGYCLANNFDILDQSSTGNSNGGYQDFIWEASPFIVGVNGRKDFLVFADGVIRCTVSNQMTGTNGQFESELTDAGCD